MKRDFGHKISGLGPKQSVDDVARAIVGCIRRPRPEVYPQAVSRGLTVLNALAPGFTDWFVRRYGAAGAMPIRPVPAGTFLMGSDSGQDDERPVHAVYVDAFDMSVHPVTRGEYARFLEAAGHDAPRDWTDPALAGDDRPVVGVSWNDARRLLRVVRDARTSSAPSHRGGVGTRRARRPRGGGVSLGRRDAVVDSRWRPRTARRPVAGDPRRAERVRALGIAANVHEWCADWHDRGYYAVSPERNPQGPASGVRRASRGGSWRHAVTISRCAARSKIDCPCRCLPCRRESPSA